MTRRLVAHTAGRQERLPGRHARAARLDAVLLCGRRLDSARSFDGRGHAAITGRRLPPGQRRAAPRAALIRPLHLCVARRLESQLIPSAYRRRRDGTWLRISDENVRPATRDQALAANPFLIAYERIDAPPRRSVLDALKAAKTDEPAPVDESPRAPPVARTVSRFSARAMTPKL